MHEKMIEALRDALRHDPDPAVLKWPVAVLAAAFFGLLLFAVFQYQTSERRWGMKLVLGLLGCATVVGLGTSAFHWITGLLYGVGYLLTWLAWVLTARWPWWRRALARGLTAGISLGPWLWLGATEKDALRYSLPDHAAKMAGWLVTPSALVWFWMLLGALWMLVLVGGYGCWRWTGLRSGRRRWLVVSWAVLGILGLNWYAAGRVSLILACLNGQSRRLGYILMSRPGAQWYRAVSDATTLHLAASGGSAKAIRLLVAAGVDANAKECNGWTPLFYCDWFDDGADAVVRELLDAGARINERSHEGQTALDYAFESPIGDLLRQAGGKTGKELGGWTPLHQAAERGDPERIRALLTAGADARARIWNGQTPLHAAAEAGHAEAIRLLLAAGADVNATTNDGWTPLEAASTRGRVEALKILLDAGALVDAKPNDGWTPLHWASAYGYAEAVGLLLAAGADPNARNENGWTPLLSAVEQGSAEAVRLLLAAGADTNARNPDGGTPLHVAATNNRVEPTRLLLAAGAKVNERTNAGQTALDLAQNDECRKLLREAGGKTGEELDAEKQAPAK